MLVWCFYRKIVYLTSRWGPMFWLQQKVSLHGEEISNMKITSLHLCAFCTMTFFSSVNSIFHKFYAMLAYRTFFLTYRITLHLLYYWGFSEYSSSYFVCWLYSFFKVFMCFKNSLKSPFEAWLSYVFFLIKIIIFKCSHYLLTPLAWRISIMFWSKCWSKK